MFDAVMRKENILVMSHNTIRLNDFCLRKEILKLVNVEENDEVCKLKTVSRISYTIGDEFGISEESFNKFKLSSYANLYFSSPKTLMYILLDNLKLRKNITNNAYLLHNTLNNNLELSNINENGLETITYDGNIDKLEDIINKLKITTIFLDDIEILHQLVSRENIELKGMTFLISKIGYNFEKTNSDILRMKHDYLNELSYEKNFEFGFVDLFNFSEESLYPEKFIQEDDDYER